MSNVDKRSVEGQVPVRLCNYTDVYYGDRITPSADLMKATATPDQVKAFRLDIGDVVVTKDSEDASDIGVPAFVEESAPDLLCGYHLAVLRPLQDRTSGRYLYWAMASRRVQDHFSVNATGITRYGLRTDSISAAPIPWWPVPTQRAIADFLDEETARIDALIAKKRRLIDALSERASRLLTSHFERLGVLFPSDLDGAVDWVLPPDWRLAHLSVVLNQLTNGFVGPTRDILRDDGIPYIQSLHIKNGGIDFGRRPFYVSEEWLS